jgi:hypothetical protein
VVTRLLEAGEPHYVVESIAGHPVAVDARAPLARPVDGEKATLACLGERRQKEAVILGCRNAMPGGSCRPSRLSGAVVRSEAVFES